MNAAKDIKGEAILKRSRRTRVVATLGPASASEAMIERLFKTGVDVFRINMSHGDHADKEPLFHAIRSVEKKLGRPTTILVDLQGPKLRIGKIAGGAVMLKAGAPFQLDLEPAPGDTSRAPLPHPEIFAAMDIGTELLLDDGKLKLVVTSFDADSAMTRVVVGGKLSDRKGVNVPNAVLPLAALTEKDRRDLSFGLKMEADWIALSFVQRPEDVAEAKKLVAGKAAVMAKIEKPSAVQAIENIVDLADGVMVARGDLGVEEPLENVPAIQQRIIEVARQAGKPVVVATQMLESMISAPVPTRAEVSDVATAVRAGADGIMLSAESAVGEYPLEAVSVMNRVAQKTEAELHVLSITTAPTPTATAEDAITAGARQVAETLSAKSIVTYTTSGATALRMARERPTVPILVLTPDQRTARRLGMVWGVHVVKTRDVDSFEEMIAKAKRMVMRQQMAAQGDRIVITAGVPFGVPGATNVLHVSWVQGNELDGF